MNANYAVCGLCVCVGHDRMILLICARPVQWWRAGPGGLTVSSAPLLHFPANLKHNKRPFYPQNKLTITQIFTQKYHIFAKYQTKHVAPILGQSYGVKRSILPVFLCDICVGIFVIT